MPNIFSDSSKKIHNPTCVDICEPSLIVVSFVSSRANYGLVCLVLHISSRLVLICTQEGPVLVKPGLKVCNEIKILKCCIVFLILIRHHQWTSK